jgi:undecaprenyl pyrophosphate phosphatase UppP
MSHNSTKTFQYIWATISLLVLGTAIYNTFLYGLQNSWFLYILFIIAGMMFLLRRIQAKNNSGIQ